MEDKTSLNGKQYVRLTSLFADYKLPRVRAWVEKYYSGSLEILEVDDEGGEDEWLLSDIADLAVADINRKNPNEIDLEMVYERVLGTHGEESAEAFKAELLRMREKKELVKKGGELH